MKNKNDLLTLAPMEEYQAPDLPTLEESEPEFLKKLPSRWKNKAMTAAMTGLFGVNMLSGCGNTLRDYQSAGNEPTLEGNRTVNDSIPYAMPNDRIVCPDLHWGGAGESPMYVVYLTEQEALELIRNELAEVGLNLNEISPSRSITVDGVYVEDEWDGDYFRILQDDIEMQMLDEDGEIGVSVISRFWDWGLDTTCTIETSERIVQTFLEDQDVSVGVFFNRSLDAWGTWDEEKGVSVLSEEEEAELRARIEDELITQVQEFIEQLRVDGIIE